MITEMELNKAIEEASISGGFGNDKITEYFEPYSDRIVFVNDDTYTEKNGNIIHMYTKVLVKANINLSSMSSLFTLKSGYVFESANDIAPVGWSSYPKIDSDLKSINKVSTNYLKDDLIVMEFTCKFKAVIL